MPLFHWLLKVIAWLIATALSAGLAFFFGSGFTLLVTAHLDPDSVRPTTAIEIDRFNLRSIGQATIIHAVDHNDNLPHADTIWDHAALLAYAGLTEADVWMTHSLRPKNMPVLLRGSRGEQSINPAFLSQSPTIAAAKGPLTLGMPATTPIVWTAGLNQDGTWSAESAYGGKEGLICFLGGNVGHFQNLHENGGALVHFSTGMKTHNILDALPPGTSIIEAPQTSLREAFERKHFFERVRGIIQMGWFVWLILVFAPVNFLLLRAFGLHSRRIPKWLLLLPVGFVLALILSMLVIRQL